MKSLKDSKNHSISVTKQRLKHLSGTKTAWQVNLEQYRSKLLQSVDKHLDHSLQQEQSLNSQEYSKVKPESQAQAQKLSKSRERIDNLRKTIMSNQSGRKIHGRFLSQPVVDFTLANVTPRSPLQKLNQSMISQQSRPHTSAHTNHAKSLNMSLISSQDKAFKETLKSGRFKGAFNLNSSLISDFQTQKHSYLKGYNTLKDSYQGTLIKSYLEEARQRQDLIHHEQEEHQDSLNFTQSKQGKTAQNFYQKLKQDDFDQQVSLPQPSKDYRSTTKGRFAHIQISNPATNFSRDKRWQLKANPLAKQAEDKYLNRDKYLLEKRRFQRILKEIQCEEAAGIKGVTKMPEQYIQQVKSTATATNNL